MVYNRFLCRCVCFFADKPGAPGRPEVEDVDEDSVTLNWTKPKDDGGDKIQGYVVEMREGGSSKWTPCNNVRLPIRNTSYTVENLETGKPYEFRVRAKNTAGLGEPSATTGSIEPKSKAKKASAPGIPEVDDVGKNYVDLSWTRPRSSGGSRIKGYQVEKRKRGGDWEKVTNFPVTGENTTVGDLDEGEEYEFRVAAVTDVGPGDYSLVTNPTLIKAKKGKHVTEIVFIEAKKC